MERKRMRLADLTLDEMIDMAKKRDLLHRAYRDGEQYVLEIGAGEFRLKPDEARKLVENMLRQYVSGFE